MLEKQNVAEENRTPEEELNRPDENWDKEAAAEFVTVPAVPEAPVIPAVAEK